MMSMIYRRIDDHFRLTMIRGRAKENFAGGRGLIREMKCARSSVLCIRSACISRGKKRCANAWSRPAWFHNPPPLSRPFFSRTLCDLSSVGSRRGCRVCRRYNTHRRESINSRNANVTLSPAMCSLCVGLRDYLPLPLPRSIPTFRGQCRRCVRVSFWPRFGFFPIGFTDCAETVCIPTERESAKIVVPFSSFFGFSSHGFIHIYIYIYLFLSTPICLSLPPLFRRPSLSTLSRRDLVSHDYIRRSNRVEEKCVSAS